MKKLGSFYKTMPISQNPNNRLQEFREFLIDVADEIDKNKNNIKDYTLKTCIGVLKQITPEGCVFGKDSLNVVGFWEVRDHN